MNIYEAFQSKPLEEDGKWFDIGPTTKIKLLYMGCEKARRKHENLMRPFAQRQKMGLELTEDESKAINAKFLSECLVLSWEGMEGKNKEAIPYSAEAVAVLCEALPRFTALILRIAMDETNFEKELVEAEQGN